MGETMKKENKRESRKRNEKSAAYTKEGSTGGRGYIKTLRERYEV